MKKLLAKYLHIVFGAQIMAMKKLLAKYLHIVFGAQIMAYGAKFYGVAWPTFGIGVLVGQEGLS